MYDVITVGSATVDVFAKTEFSELIRKKKKGKITELLAYPTGSKILVEELEFTTGGCGTNTAVAFSRLGHKVAWIGKLGNDSNADYITKKLKEEKVDILAAKGKEPTGYSIILDSLKHDRTILAYKGANNHLKFSEISLKKLKTRWLYMSCLLEGSLNTQKKLAKYAEKKGIKIAYNISPYLAEKGANNIKEILQRTEVFILNRCEAEYLVKGKNVPQLLKNITKLGPKIAVITEGRKGAFAYDGTHYYQQKPNNIKVIESTGAGDAFASSFICGMIKKNDINFAMKLAQTNAESVIQYHGAKNKLLKYSEIIKKIKK